MSFEDGHDVQERFDRIGRRDRNHGVDADAPLDQLLRPAPKPSMLDVFSDWVSSREERSGAGRGGSWMTLAWLAVGAALGFIIWAVVFQKPVEPVELPTVDSAIIGASPTEVRKDLATTTPTSDVAKSQKTGVVVHVAGHVNDPGVINASAGARVEDAVALAGGATKFADLNALNLAKELVDGERIYVPAIGEVSAGDLSPSAPSSPSTGTSSGSEGNEANSESVLVNINTADVTELEKLTGVGPKTAEAIVAYRTENGAFGSVAELEDVAGIGPSKLASIEPNATVGP